MDSNFKFGMLEGEARAYGSCDFEVSFKQRIAEPPPHFRGNVARIYFFMHEMHGITISRQQRQLFNAWNKLDPVDAQECQRDKIITSVQGYSNSFVQRHCF